jgi:L-rhamnose isomerase
MKLKNVDILKDLNIRENWLTNNILSRKIKYFGHIKRHSSMERAIMEGMVAGRRGRGRPRRRWIQDVKETLNMSIDQVGHLAREPQTGCEESDFLRRTSIMTKMTHV